MVTAEGAWVQSNLADSKIREHRPQQNGLMDKIFCLKTLRP